jgi:NOL1/NOP2/fmu family ribosome biogenesis protein
MVRPGGVLAYATCTFAPEEDEAVVARFLGASPDFKIAAPPPLPGCLPARPDWAPDGAAEGLRHVGDPLQRAVRLWPHIGPGEGHFVAVMRRRDDPRPYSPGDAGRRAGRPAMTPAPRPVEALYRAFCGDHLTTVPGDAPGRLALTGAYLYALPNGLPDLDGLRVIHPGWWLGVLRKDRFEPSHALALALAPSDAAQTLPLDPDDPRLHTYLRGELFADPGRDGWVLVTVSGFPLGWGKRVDGRLKSRYPKGLRRP